MAGASARPGSFCGNGVRHLNSQEYWEVFAHTGSVLYYLGYKQQQNAENTEPPPQKEATNHADRDTGPGPAGGKGGGIG